MGVQVCITDVKGDVAGLAMAGSSNEKVLQKAAQTGIDGFSVEGNPVLFWELFG